jgi:hypothetical protein
MNLAYLILPAIGVVILLFIYVMILVRRIQRVEPPQTGELQRPDASLQREKFWWVLTMVILLLTIMAFSASLSFATNVIGLKTSLGIGLIFWFLLAIIGYKITS